MIRCVHVLIQKHLHLSLSLRCHTHEPLAECLMHMAQTIWKHLESSSDSLDSTGFLRHFLLCVF